MTLVRANGSQRIMLYWEQFFPVNACHVLEFGPGCAASVSDFAEAVATVLSSVGIGTVALDQRSATYHILPGNRSLAEQAVRTAAGPEFVPLIESQVDSELSRPFLREGCPLRFVWLEERAAATSESSETSAVPDSRRRRAVIITYRHAVADSFSIRMVATQLLNALCGRPVAGPFAVYPGTLLRDTCRNGLVSAACGFATWTLRELLALSRCVRPKIRSSETVDCPVTRIHSETISLADLTHLAKSCDASLQDLLFAALLEALSEEPTSCQSSFLRTRIAVQCPVDLRRQVPVEKQEQFGQLLGSWQVRRAVRSRQSFREQVEHVRQQTRTQKQRNEAVYYATGMALLSLYLRLLPKVPSLSLSRAALPVMGGLSNSDLTAAFQDEVARGEIVQYFRAGYFGHSLPIMIFATSFGGLISFVSTRRSGFLNDEAIDRMIGRIVRQCSELV